MGYAAKQMEISFLSCVSLSKYTRIWDTCVHSIVFVYIASYTTFYGQGVIRSTLAELGHHAMWCWDLGQKYVFEI